MHRHHHSHASLWLAAVALAATLATPSFAGQTPVSAAITYQGQLRSGGNPFSGLADFQFLLFEGSGGGAAQVGATLAASAVSVNAGVFTVSLDFGQLAFAGNERWLEIRVNAPGNGGAGPYTTLTPRQRLTAAPYAAFALNVPNPSPFAFNGSNAVFTGGNVGIGTDSPTSKLHVAGDVTATGIVQSLNSTLESTVFLGWGTDGTGNDMARIRVGGGGVGASNGLDIQRIGNASLMRILNNGNVGIGNTAPAQRLHVSGGARFGDGSTYAEFNGNPGEGVLRYNDAFGPKMIFRNAHSGASTIVGRIIFEDPAQVAAIGYSSQLGSPAGLAFSGAANVHMKLTDAGDIGIATASPEARLQVATGTDVGPGSGGYIITGPVSGTNIGIDNNEIMARVAGAPATLYLNHNGGDVHIGQSGAASTVFVKVLTITGGADLSEAFDVAPIDQREPEPGMVVCIDPDNPGKLMPSTRAYDRTVAGVISGAGGVRTGMLMGQDGSLADGAHPVALTGRVYVLADASDGPIAAGDLLTSSDTPGHAMTASDRDRRDGAIIGKAMTSLERGERGLVLVLISLQ